MSEPGRDHVRKPKQALYCLRLYISAGAPVSMRAIANLRRICDRHLNGQYELEIVDVWRKPSAVLADAVVAVPTLIQRSPPPKRRLVGDLADEDRVLAGLGLAGI